ncbi:DUF2200 family protein [Aquimarina rubra]|uniref:DUF2200 family protein n=1 Tax=Aquimarina rubra TaxID=1920033 RepID=A0ABW5LLF5_9FLAO
MSKTYNQNEHIANTTFASVYLLYVNKVKKKDLTKEELLDFS